MADSSNLQGKMGRMAPKCERVEFLAVEDIEPDFSFPSSGLIGLAPGNPVLTTALAFHANDDGDLVAAFDEGKPTGDLTHFFNLGSDSWVLPLENMLLDD